jgi:hypothetical protein
MKLRIPHPSPAMAVAMIALFIALGGTAFAFSSNSSNTADRAGGRSKLTLRFGKLFDSDTTQADGSFSYAIGHAVCKKGERVISGGVREIKNSGSDERHIWMVESGPVPKKRGWYVQMSSDLGGAARRDFAVVATCERK